MAQQDRAVRTREVVLTAAGEAFAANGYHGTSMAEIFERAGVTKGALYFHFKSKDDLVRAVVEGEEKMAAKVCEEELAKQDSAARTLVAISVRWVHLIRFDPVVRGGVRLLVERAMYDLPMLDPYNRWESVVGELLRRAYEEGDLRLGVEPDAAAEFVVATFTGVQFLSRLRTGHEDLPERIDIMWQIVFSGLLREGRRVMLASGQK